MSDIRTGGCLCGAVRYEAKIVEDGPQGGLGACHCGMCRKHTGGVMISANTGTEGLTFTKDDGLATYTSSDWAERGLLQDLRVEPVLAAARRGADAGADDDLRGDAGRSERAEPDA